MHIVNPSIELLWITDNPEKQIEAAGRTCYKSEDKITDDSAQEFATRMRNSGHHAMLEHAVASFRIITDRGITHEIVRHRLASYAQESTRYCDYSAEKHGEHCSFIEPPDLTEEQRPIWLEACEIAEKQYFSLTTKNCKPQIARSVLPNCLKTEIVMTANFREWRLFIETRIQKAAHPQIRPIAASILDTLIEQAPSVFSDLTRLVNDYEDLKDLYKRK